MKRLFLHRTGLLLGLCALLFSGTVHAQVTKTTFNFKAPVVVNFHNLAEYEKDHPVALKPRFVEQGEDRDKFIYKPLPVSPNAKVHILPSKGFTATPAVTSPAASQNFQGVLDNGTLIPPDINGAVGKTYVIETTNQQFNIYTKSSGALASTLAISTLFSPSGLYGYYDPHIVYDPNNDRFMISIDAQTGSSSSSPSAFAVAVSATGDPTGSWYIYSVITTPNAPTDFMDYDQLGFNNNWIVMTGNDFPASGSNSSHIYVWPRATLYAGTAGTATAFTDATNILISPATTYDATQNTLYLVSDYNGNSGGNGYVNIETITGTATAPVYSAGTQLGINQPWQDPSALEHAPEEGETSAKGLEAGDTRIHSVIYRNGSLWFTHEVYLPASGTVKNSAVDWWQINPSALTVTQFERIADPNGLIWYYYPSLDVNANGDMLLGYSASSSTTYGGAQYAFRLASDPVNTLETAVQFVNGVAGYYKTYGGGRNRWGDFSGTAFDPVDNSFWTFQEWANTGNNWGTQVAHIPDAGAATCNTPTGMSTSSIANTTATFNWTAVSGSTGYNVQYRVVGTTTWSTGTTATNSYNATGLTAGANYEWQVQNICSATSTSSFSASTDFTTTGGCGTPTGLSVSSITISGATTGWTAVTGANSYNLEYGTSLTSLTTISGIATNSQALTSLTAGTKYYFEVQTVCASGNSSYSAVDSFTTSTSCGTPTGLSVSSITTSGATAGWTAVLGANSYNLEYGTSLTSLTTITGIATNSQALSSLTAGTKYYFEVQTVCASGNSTYSAVDSFTTTSACATPTGLTASSVTSTGATAGWTAVSGASSYSIQYGTSKTALTTVTGITTNSYALSSLTASTKYYFEVETICASGNSSYSAFDSFTTSSGTITYCASKGTTTYEYIKTVKLGTINHTVTNDGGYGNYTSVSTNLAAGTAYTISLSPGFTSSKYTEHFTVYIDYNQDGTLNGTGETVVTGSTSSTLSKSFTVPTTAKSGSTRMRVQMEYGASSTNPCATLTYGDVQDFTVNITGGTGPSDANADVTAEDNLLPISSSLSVIPNPISGRSNATAIYNLASQGNTTLRVIDLTGRTLYSQNLGVQSVGPHNYLLSNIAGKLHSGYYVVVLEQNGQIVARNRFIVAN